MEQSPKGYLVSVSRTHSGIGEIVQIQTNCPGTSTQEELEQEVIKIAHAIEKRFLNANEDVLKRTGKNLRELGLDDLAGLVETGKKVK